MQKVDLYTADKKIYLTVHDKVFIIQLNEKPFLFALQ